MSGSDALAARIAPHLELLYPREHVEVTRQLVDLAEAYAPRLSGRHFEPPTHRTSCLITYGDGIRRRGEAPLHTLTSFLRDHVGDVLSDVHLLPMFPWTSDDGFAVVDHREVNPALGTWADVARVPAASTAETRNWRTPSRATRPPSIPSHRTVCGTPAGTTPGVHCATAAPSAARTSWTTTSAGCAPPRT